MPELDTGVNYKPYDPWGFGRPDLAIWHTDDGGWILATNDGRKAAVAAPPDHANLNDSEADQVALLDLVTSLRDLLGLWGSRYDRQRFYAELRPGDKALDDAYPVRDSDFGQDAPQ